MITVKIGKTAPTYWCNFEDAALETYNNQDWFYVSNTSHRQILINMLKKYNATLCKFGFHTEVKFHNKNDHLMFMLEWA